MRSWVTIRPFVLQLMVVVLRYVLESLKCRVHNFVIWHMIMVMCVPLQTEFAQFRDKKGVHLDQRKGFEDGQMNDGSRRPDFVQALIACQDTVSSVSLDPQAHFIFFFHHEKKTPPCRQTWTEVHV
jgi:hypothetical protein